MGGCLKKRGFYFAVFSIAVFSSCLQKNDPYNSLTYKEGQGGWELLFDGKTLRGWHAYNATTIPPVWQVKNGELQCIQIPSNIEHADLVTDSIYENFDLRFQWKIERGGNSGVMVNVQEYKKYAATFFTGPEFQMLDNDNDSTHRGSLTEIAGCIYGVAPYKGESKPKPFGEWNESRIVQNNGQLTFWLNGIETADIQINSHEWNELVAKSPLHRYADFGKLTSGRIALQDHIDEAAFRSIKIKKL
jgi:hypothetical protein